MNEQVKATWLQILRDPSVTKCAGALSRGPRCYCAEGAFAEAFIRCFPEEGYAWSPTDSSLIYIDVKRGSTKAWKMDVPKAMRDHAGVQVGDLFVKTDALVAWLAQNGIQKGTSLPDIMLEYTAVWFLNDRLNLTLPQIADIIEEVGLVEKPILGLSHVEQ